MIDGGGSGPVAAPTFTGTQSLSIEPSSIPAALSAFREAHHRLARKVEQLGGLPITQWAGDPVSSETVKEFTERSTGGGEDSAIACLTGYQRQLERAIDSLQSAHDSYLATEGTNTERWGKYDQAD
jgi:hypothetical protein